MKNFRLLLVLFLAFSIPGCSVLNALDVIQALYPKASLKQLQVIAEADANQTTATALDLVFVYDKTAIPLLPKSGPEWFSKKKSIVASQPGNFDVVSLEVPPGMIIDAPLPKRSNRSVGAFIFANYLSRDGQFPVNLTTYTSAEIHLKAMAIDYKAATP